VVKVSRDGLQETDENAVLMVKDYEKYAQVCYDLLAKLQRIKAEREETELKELYDRYAPLESIKSSWFQAVIKRGEKLEANSGVVEQPWVVRKGRVETFGSLTLEGIAPHYEHSY
jgi:hypothetical protein